MIEQSIKLAEKCFLTCQGEGASQGRSCLFIRFFGCNLSCSECDTPYTWRPSAKRPLYELTSVELDEFMSKTDRVIFTGGEPVINSNRIEEIIRAYPEKQYEIETNGTLEIKNEFLLDCIVDGKLFVNISPKLNFKQDSQNSTEVVLLSQLQHLNDNYVVKFLFREDEDIEFIRQKAAEWNVPAANVWCQPMGTTGTDVIEISRRHYDKIVASKFNLSIRTHVVLFDNREDV